MAKYLYLAIVVLLCAFAVNCQANDDENLGPQKRLELGDVTVQIAGKSGRLKIWRGDDESSVPPIHLFLDELTEVDADGNAVGTSGNTKHSFKSFASQDFTFSDPASGLIPNSNVSSDFMSFSGQLNGLTSELKMTVYIAEEDGDITLNEEVTSISTGDVKFTLELENWDWCGCTKGQTQEEGAFVDVVLTLAGPPGRDDAFRPSRRGGSRGRRPEEYDLGLGASFSLSTQVRRDGEWESLPDGYPKFEETGNKNKFIFRFPRFTSEIFYDPSITPPGSGASFMTSSLLVVLASLILRFF